MLSFKSFMKLYTFLLKQTDIPQFPEVTLWFPNKDAPKDATTVPVTVIGPDGMYDHTLVNLFLVLSFAEVKYQRRLCIILAWSNLVENATTQTF